MKLHIQRNKDSVAIQIEDREVFIDWETAIKISEHIQDLAYNVEGIVGDEDCSVPARDYNVSDKPIIME